MLSIIKKTKIDEEKLKTVYIKNGYKNEKTAKQMKTVYNDYIKIEKDVIGKKTNN